MPDVPKVKDKNVLAEVVRTAQVDERSGYLDHGEEATIEIAVRLRGQPEPGARVLVTKYNGLPSGSTPLIESKQRQVVEFTTGDRSTITVGTGSAEVSTDVTVVTADGNGLAKLGVKAVSPGFPILQLFPFKAKDEAKDGVPYGEVGDKPSLSTGFFATLRVFPDDEPLVDEFVGLWNTNYANPKVNAPQLAWEFVYGKILYVYDMLYPVMLKWVPLGDRARVEAAIDQVLTLISPEYAEESTLAMPITRDLSAGKRRVLQLWGNLVKRQYPQAPITKEPPIV